MTGYMSAGPVPDTLPISEPAALTLDEQREYMRLAEMASAGTLTEEDGERLAELDARQTARHEWERERMEDRKRERQAQDEESRRRTAEYVRMLNAADPREADRDSLAYFQARLTERYRMAEPLTLGTTQEAIAGYLTAAYSRMVETTGHTMTADAETQRIIADAARWLYGHQKPGLLLRGNVGVGKTTLLKAIAAVIGIRTQQPCQIWEARRIAVLGKGAEGQAVLDRISQTPMLAIDDIGTEPLAVKDYGNEVMPVVELLTERYNRRLTTLITTNLTVVDGKDEIAERYGERIADRLRELCNTLSYDGSQKSYRV